MVILVLWLRLLLRLATMVMEVTAGRGASSCHRRRRRRLIDEVVVVRVLRLGRIEGGRRG